ncbi:UNVERIFIED_CONTAM: hypothetical protein PYX00_010551 [Menopon gallinae]|uniref:THD domain-containing protein n=1 Tax=Menopon gallinae TaxID=328185 RepID=A0AAW2HG21_9NEOP
MTNQVSSKQYEEVYLCGTNSRNPPQFRNWKLCSQIFEILLFLTLTCAVMYSYKSIWNLRCEVEVLKERLRYTLPGNDDFFGEKLTSKSGDYDNESDNDNIESTSDGELEDDDSTFRIILGKRKREIRLSKENTSDQSMMSEEKKTSSGYSGSEEYSSELLLNGLNNYSTSPKPRRTHRKSKKYHRNTVSAEKFYTEIESTTSTPIHIRKSRTKQTDSAEKGKYKHSYERRPLLQVYGSKESITREEAMRRSNNLGNLIPERIEHLAKQLRVINATSAESSSRELAESIPYNMIMVHYAADTSRYSRERDAHYFGNGRMQMKTSVYKDWKPAHWTQGMEISKYFLLNQGKVTVSVTGIYLIYAQVQYTNVQEVNGYAVMCNKQMIVQCITTSVHPDKDEVKSNTCDTSTTILLHANDKISIQDLHHGRHVVLTPEKSYFGLILLSPFRANKYS